MRMARVEARKMMAVALAKGRSEKSEMESLSAAA